MLFNIFFLNELMGQVFRYRANIGPLSCPANLWGKYKEGGMQMWISMNLSNNAPPISWYR
tara:strand:- start:249 stop:428 length:180 start_codon:yes stop_codon:yes gene_type:complete